MGSVIIKGALPLVARVVDANLENVRSIRYKSGGIADGEEF